MKAQATGLTKIFFSGYFSVSIPTESLGWRNHLPLRGPGIMSAMDAIFAGAFDHPRTGKPGMILKTGGLSVLYVVGLKDTENP